MTNFDGKWGPYARMCLMKSGGWLGFLQSWMLC